MDRTAIVMIGENRRARETGWCRAPATLAPPAQQKFSSPMGANECAAGDGHKRTIIGQSATRIARFFGFYTLGADGATHEEAAGAYPGTPRATAAERITSVTSRIARFINTEEQV